MDKQKALDRLNLIRVWYEDYGTPDADYDAICYAINIIEEAPEGLDNLIKALEQEHKKLREMQKALPEIIYCKDCKYRGVGNYCVYGTRLAWITKSNDFCSRAERRTDERSD